MELSIPGMEVVKTIVFDFGNVVGFFDHRRTTERLAPYSELTMDRLHSTLFQGELELAYELGQLKTEDFLRRAREHGRLCCTEDEIAAAWREIFWPNEEIVALVPRLKPHYRILLASNTNDLHAVQFRTQFAESLGWFDALVLSHEVGARKPSRSFFAECQRLADCRPSECLFLDDLEANVRGAREFGWRAIHYRADAGDLEKQLVAHGVLSKLNGSSEG